MIKKEIIDKVLDTVRIEEVVGDFVELKKRGTSLIGNCPFHNEKTPSFHVSVAKGIYKCFGCGAGGDSLKFVMEHEKYSYPEAIRYLAQKYHIDVEEVAMSPVEMAKQDKRESLMALTNWAGKFFVNQLWLHDEGKAIGLSYFKERGYTEDIIKKFELGYSPEQWSSLIDEAHKAGYVNEYLVATGLAIQRDDQSLYDRFRGRVIFPIHNLSGRIIGFGGRILKTDKKAAKYVNSPESEIYHKSNVLYGLHLAKKAIVAEDNCLLVEGYADVLSVFQAGIENVVSSSGTSLTTGQIRLIARYTKNVTILYDGDAAGIKASLRGTDMLLEEGLNVKILLFPNGEDPDSFVQKNGSKAFKTYLNEQQKDFILFKTDLLLKDSGNDPIKKAAIVRDILESIALIPDEIKISVFVRECSSLLDMSEQMLLSELNKIRIDKRKSSKSNNQTPSQSQGNSAASPGPDQAGFENPKVEGETISAETLQEREIIRILLNYGQEMASWEADGDIPVAGFLLDNIDDVTFKDSAASKILQIYREHASNFEVPDVKQFYSNSDPEIAALAIDCVAHKYNLSENWNDDKRKIYVPMESENLKELVISAVYRIKKRKIEATMKDIRLEIQHERDLNELDILMFKYQKLKDAEKLLGDLLGNTIVK